MTAFCPVTTGYPLLSLYLGSNTMTKPIAFPVALTLSLTLVACGGGGGGGDTSTSSTPTTPTAPSTVLPSVSVAIPSASYAAGSAELGGWTVLQQARVLCGFGALTQNTRLDAAALSHARYQNSISIASGVSELTHYETVTSNPYYTGYNPWDRTSYQGYGNLVAEILEATVWNYDSNNPPVFPTLQARGASSMLSLLNTVYHLQGAMYEGADVGFGADLQTVATGTARREEYRFGSLNGYQSTARRIKLGTGNLATYPCQGSSNIPSAFVPANESPNPFPAMTSTSQTVGPPIYLKADAGQVLSVTSSSISKGGVSVSTQLLNRSNDPQVPREIGTHEAFVVPSSALSPNSTYQVNLGGTLNGIPFTRSFTMSTGQ